ncbi:MAG: GDP-mannose 4,6-dehydratase [Planctomycetota bacterium]
MRVLITGAEGFVGGHLAQLLREAGHEVIATSQTGRVGERLRLPDPSGSLRLIQDLAPEALIHLAAVSSVEKAYRDPIAAYHVNVRGTESLLEAVLAVQPKCRFLYISSSEVYGNPPASAQPISEKSGLKPINAYGWTKLAAESLLNSYSARLSTTILRPFAHTGPGQSPDFALSSFARQIAASERKQQAPLLKVGNLAVQLDYLDVRDVVDAYQQVLETPEAVGTFNVCSGIPQRLSDLLDMLCDFSKISLEVQVEAGRLRKNDLNLRVGDAGKLCAATGWQPTSPMAQTLRELLEYWRHEPSLEEGTHGGAP